MKATSSHYDGIIVGSGQGGNPLAKALANAGWRVALIERQYVGGSCLNYGCTPTKTMVASAREAYMSSRARDYGALATSGGVDMERVRQRKRDMVETSRKSAQHGLEKVEGLDLIFGAARFTGPGTLAVKKKDDETLLLSAGKIFIDTGTRAARPKIDGFDKVANLANVLDNVSIMELGQVPEHLVILGGGYIGVEFAQMFRRFGSRVTIVQSGPQLLMREDGDIAEEVVKILREDGIDVLLDARVTQVRGDAGEITLEREDGPLKGTHLLVAVGRVPNTDDLDLAAAGVETDDHGYVRVNGRLETNVEGVYGIGDVKGGPAFTHISYDDFRVLRTNLLEGGSASIEGRMVPYTVFMDPQLGRIGMTEGEALDQGRDIRVAKMPMTSVARAREFGETRGVMKVVVDGGTKQILGAAVLGMEGGELAGMFQLAMMGGLPYPVVQEGIFSHPTLAESLNVIFEHFD